MTLRHEEAGFAGGALVFPGGKVDPADRPPPGIARTRRLDEATLVLRIAAIRETFEECGILLARAGGALLSAGLAAMLQRHAADAGFAALVAAAGLELAIDDLVPYAHWITPVDRPKRFDTHFFLAPAAPARSPSMTGARRSMRHGRRRAVLASPTRNASSSSSRRG